MADRMRDEKRKRNAEYAKRFKKKKQKAKRAPGEARPAITLLPASGPFLAVCSRCAKEAELPFRPTGSKPVYCDACYTLVRSGAIAPERAGLVTGSV